jgi:hypothetical protein
MSFQTFFGGKGLWRKRTILFWRKRVTPPGQCRVRTRGHFQTRVKPQRTQKIRGITIGPRWRTHFYWTSLRARRSVRVSV